MQRKKVLRLLRLMIKNSRVSDRELAKLLQVSQPTVTRMRSRLEQEGYIKTYTVIPDFTKMGYQILAFTFSKLRSYPTTEEAINIVQRASDWVNNRPNVIFAADGQGLGGKDVIMISFHRNYGEFTDFIHSYAFEWGQFISTFDTFMVSMKSGLTMKPLDLRYLARDEREE